MKTKGFTPTQIIFAATDACNLHCEHCFVSRTPNKLDINQAKTFLKSCKNSSIYKIGFSGGEPFLYLDFVLQIIKFCVEQDFLFDQIMTNGDWWKTEEDLRSTLQQIFDAGYDGKIGLSWDNFHGQSTQRMKTFISIVQKIFGPDSICVQSVLHNGETSSSLQSDLERNEFLQQIKVKQYILPQTFSSSDKRAWNCKKWFKEDYCQGPGNILYIHPNGNIAPCCGFANENSELFIGTINDTFEQVMEKASKNEMVEICFTKGLSKYKKIIKRNLQKQGKKLPGKCKDICSFCDFVCKNKLKN